MKHLKYIALATLVTGLSACSTVDIVSRNTAFQGTPVATAAPQQIVRDYRVQSVRFAVPEDLTVSEANSYYPIADIVWRGDPLGDRGAQIAEIFETSIDGAGAALDGATPVTVDVVLARFHSLTERTRYSVGGTHSIKFDLTVRHARTGAVLEPTRRIVADFPALGGSAAMAAEGAGQTQKVRIISRLTSLFRQELSGVSETGPAAGTDA
ncbi:DUF6778 family protein [Thalassorhabdomicrobium marinisediminis]|uniref:ABC-type transport auxiliary lipoprotein component domain-containing protein n=1 Tax=Thalassorhabdomicrobium marinisediminis TaxID=2170577 RepID=A0A2T7G0Y6_9RHOB|nr:DUF6778 family protein [Thalassorhabdomicrobium marinisediminis]PVA08093.1 hypothetical protein DC363_00910 [Thalassorhabdomicrobium marinisediminis]